MKFLELAFVIVIALLIPYLIHNGVDYYYNTPALDKQYDTCWKLEQTNEQQTCRNNINDVYDQIYTVKFICDVVAATVLLVYATHLSNDLVKNGFAASSVILIMCASYCAYKQRSLLSRLVVAGSSLAIILFFSQQLSNTARQFVVHSSD